MPDTLDRYRNRVLLVDDEEYAGDWLIAFLGDLGFGLAHCFSETQARQHLQEVANGEASYALAIFDLMVPTHTFEEMLEWEGELEDSMTTGLRLCKHTRSDLGIDEATLPILAISSRSDEGTREDFQSLGVPFLDRTQTDAIRGHIQRVLSSIRSTE